MLGKGGSCVLYLSMSQSCEEATYFSEHTYCQLPRADLTRAKEQQSKALHCVEHRAVRASLWQSGAGLMDRQEKGGRKVHQEENIPSKQEVVAMHCKYFVTQLIFKENYERRGLNPVLNMALHCTNLNSSTNLSLELQS